MGSTVEFIATEQYRVIRYDMRGFGKRTRRQGHVTAVRTLPNCFSISMWSGVRCLAAR